jgi:hypothetical protein
MKKALSLILLIATLAGCGNSQNYRPSNLTLLTPEQQIINVRNHNLPDPNTLVTKNQKGEILSIEDVEKIENLESYTVDYYQDEHGVVVEAVLRKLRESDKELQASIFAAFQEELEVKRVELDCEDKSQFLSEVYERDQGIRTDSSVIDSNIDHENLEIIVSYIEKCGFPTLDAVTKEEMLTIWLVLQHAQPTYQKKYISNFEEAAKRNEIDWSSVALMKDRALMNEGKPQIYGSQIMGDRESDGWMIYELQNPETVDKRRMEMGMEPLSEYVRKWNINFDIEQKSD